jgi:hypothetical protein
LIKDTRVFLSRIPAFLQVHAWIEGGK